MKKFFKNYSIEFFIIIIFCLIFLTCYYLEHKGGWYCEYCREGSIRGKYQVEQMYGNKPCKCSADSCHHFKFYLKEPVEKPKYVK